MSTVCRSRTVWVTTVVPGSTTVPSFRTRPTGCGVQMPPRFSTGLRAWPRYSWPSTTSSAMWSAFTPTDPVRALKRRSRFTLGFGITTVPLVLGIGEGLVLRHDHGPQYMSHAFQQEIAFLGIESSSSFIKAPEGNGVAERFIRTLKDQLLWL